VQPLLVVAHSGLHQQTRNAVLHLYHLLQHQVPVAQRASPVADLGGCHVALRQEVAAQTICDLAGIDLVVLLFGRGNRPQHQRVRYLHLLGMRKQVVIDPAREDRRFHGDRPGLGKCLDPGVQFASRRIDLAFLAHTTSRILHAIADRLLVNI